MIFVDTSAWYALYDRKEQHHREATRWFERNRTPLMTTDYVFDETLTILKARGQSREALGFGQYVFGGDTRIFLYHVEEDDLRSAWRTFVRFADKDWSFTDCVSTASVRSSWRRSA